MDVYRYLIFPRKQLTDLKTEYWIKEVVFNFHWWLMILFLIVPWIFWWRKVDKGRIREITLHGFFVLIFSSLLDNIGSQLNLWVYTSILTPISQRFEPYDYSVLPVLYMLIYQKYPKWKLFIIAQFIISAIFSFVLEPLTVYLDIYILINWRYGYSFIIYPIIGILSKMINNKLNRIEGINNIR